MCERSLIITIVIIIIIIIIITIINIIIINRSKLRVFCDWEVQTEN